MRVRNFIIGGTVGIIGAMAVTLAGIGISNLEKESRIESKKTELNDAIYPAIPPESRIVSKPTGPVLPSPGYQN